ncbi:protein bicaudal C-like isoform X2 [Ctenocephalides felis]|uniref:protein bicaudal C-like isoform X2 n=1 Tax=Ctenocephalides felis TaxID=7515 RepID=UPI000E6E1F1B|nr:protein bicaudal C-like isoform X2 [Ctenocephalides felis]
MFLDFSRSAWSNPDPHVRIAGRLLDIQQARQRVLAILDARGARVTMKLDVSYTEHSHIIGKGGLTIKKVMDETGCHIHFPDSNRSNPNEKSNQVSIAGDIAGVEKARASLRAVTPLIFSFELPVLGANQTVPDLNSPRVQQIQEGYNVQVMFRSRPKLHATLVVVKGHERDVVNVKKATMLLIKYMCDSVANQINVQMTIEISPQHHAVVLGTNSLQLKGIMQRTQTQIMFPDALDPNIPSLRRSCVTIIGNIDGVYSARQQLIGSLPLVMMFDLPDNVGTTDPDNINNLMKSLDLVIQVRHKPKQNTMSVIIKGIERNATKMYEARNKLLNITEPRIVADIPPSYHVPSGAETIALPILSQPPLSPVLSPLPWNPLGSPFTYALPTALPTAASPTSSIPQPFKLRSLQGIGVLSNVDSSQDSSGYQSYTSSSSNSLEFPNSSCSLSNSPRNNSPGSLSTTSTTNHHSQYSSLGSTSGVGSTSAINDLTASMYDLSTTDRRAPGCEKAMNTPKGLSKTIGNSTKTESGITPEMARMKMMALKALNIPPAGELRIPNSNWAGYGFSQTSQGLQSIFTEDDDVWAPTHQVTMSSPMRNSLTGPGNVTNHGSQIEVMNKNDLSVLLAANGLEKYIEIFESHEIDLKTFCSLNEHDLIQIGIKAWGARRRMLMAAADYTNKASRGPLHSTGDINMTSLNVAPGAERRHFSSSDLWP